MALTGSEIIYVQGIAENNRPAATLEQTTTQAIANLATGSGSDPIVDTVVFDGSTSGTTTLQATAIAGTTTLTLPAATDTLVGKATTDTLTNKTLTAPVIATISNSGTLTLPTSTDTLIGRATTDTLTNKTLTAPALGGSVTGTYTLAGTPTITAPTITLATLTLATAQRGTFTANGVTPVTVTNANVTANSQVLITLKTVGGTVGAYPTIQTITPTTGFTVAATASDTSVYNYSIIG